MSVATPCLVPFTTTEAPMTGSPSSAETTVPDTVVWANAAPIHSSRHAKVKISLFLIKICSLLLIFPQKSTGGYNSSCKFTPFFCSLQIISTKSKKNDKKEPKKQLTNQKKGEIIGCGFHLSWIENVKNQRGLLSMILVFPQAVLGRQEEG
jgi:hypothetical protein